MIRRCNNANRKDYKDYGGRGIKVCERWHKFDNFWDDMAHTFKEGLSIERKDVNGDYNPDNCIWADNTAQQRNKRNNRKIDFNGELHCVTEWAIKLNLSERVIRARIDRGVANEDLLKPVVYGKRKVNVFAEIDGVVKTVSQWSKESGIPFGSIRRRIKRGWTGKSLLSPIRTW